jgi:zinc protease
MAARTPRLIQQIPFGDELVIHRYRFHNGLTLLLMRDDTAPVVSFQTWFHVGSRHEKKGKTGLAHLFEHLMFNETKHLPAGQFDRLLEAAGGETNAATWVDWTYYYENVPSGQLPLVIQLEADRMQNLVLREPQVSSEKEVVANERRFRVDDDVEGSMNELLYATAFTTHPYHWPTIGWMRDIQRFTTRDCEQFYRTYYAPNNATVVVVGDVDEPALLAQMQERYGGIAAARIPRERVRKEPRQVRERRKTIRRPTPSEKVLLGYHGPAFGDPDHTVMTVLNEVLVGGRSSRLYRTLLLDREIATEVRGSMAPFSYPGLYELWVSMREGHSARDAVDELQQEITRMQRDLVSEAELQKVCNRLELGVLESMESVGGKAEQLGFYETVLGEPAGIFDRLAAFRAVRPEDVRRVARTYLKRTARTMITALPSGDRSDDAAPSSEDLERGEA